MDQSGTDPVIDGNMVAKDFKLFDDMDEWKEKVKFPPLDFMPIEQIFQAMCGGMHVNPETDVVSCLILSGQFERMNQLIGMEMHFVLSMNIRTKYMSFLMLCVNIN